MVSLNPGLMDRTPSFKRLRITRYTRYEIFLLEQFSRVAEAYEVLRNLETRALFDQFGEEGLKNGLPKKMGGWSEGYTFHGDAKRVFRDFFGTDNPSADFQVYHRDKNIVVFTRKSFISGRNSKTDFRYQITKKVHLVANTKILQLNVSCM